ncbi:MAG TPA: hypothetical protein DCY94_04440 [Firmicutes bacterium]|nr:hypothetical protein [Bacillota bacterium]
MISLNILDYLKKYGDTLLKDIPLNEVDYLILTRISYLPLDTVLKKHERKKMRELWHRFQKLKNYNLHYLWRGDKLLFPLVLGVARYANFKLSKYKIDIDTEHIVQFAAVTIEIDNARAFISYRGTDDSITGLKDDFLMTYLSHTYSQKYALEYLENVSPKYEHLILGGHSKGGNLAMYSAIFIEDVIKNKIDVIYNIDGPGFQDEIVTLDEYNAIVPKIKTYLSEDSIVGMFLNHKEERIVIKSTASLIFEHDIYSWVVEDLTLKRAENISTISTHIDKSIKDWWQEIDYGSRRTVIEIIFTCLDSVDITTYSEIKKNTLAKAKKLYMSYKGLTPEDKQKINETLLMILSIVKSSLFTSKKK